MKTPEKQSARGGGRGRRELRKVAKQRSTGRKDRKETRSVLRWWCNVAGARVCCISKRLQSSHENAIRPLLSRKELRFVIFFRISSNVRSGSISVSLGK